MRLLATTILWAAGTALANHRHDSDERSSFNGGQRASPQDSSGGNNKFASDSSSPSQVSCRVAFPDAVGENGLYVFQYSFRFANEMRIECAWSQQSMVKVKAVTLRQYNASAPALARGSIEGAQQAAPSGAVPSGGSNSNGGGGSNGGFPGGSNGGSTPAAGSPASTAAGRVLPVGQTGVPLARAEPVRRQQTQFTRSENVGPFIGKTDLEII